MPSSRSAALRLLSFPEPPDNHHSNHPPLELDESDVVWSPTAASAHSSDTDSPHSPPSSSTAAHLRRILSDDRHHHRPPLLRRKSSLSATRMIPPEMRSESSAAAPRFPMSAPVNIPAWPAEKKSAGGFGGRYLQQLDEEEKDFDEDEEEMVPPHVIVARSHVTFSVFEGAGRTLKGRDLCRVRNAVFQQTGFID